MEEVGALLQPIWTMRMDKIVRCVVCEEREEKTENVKTLMHAFEACR